MVAAPTRLWISLPHFQTPLGNTGSMSPSGARTPTDITNRRTRNAANTVAFAASEGVKEKWDKYKSELVVPISFEPYGRLAPKSFQCLEEMAINGATISAHSLGRCATTKEMVASLPKDGNMGFHRCCPCLPGKRCYQDGSSDRTWRLWTTDTCPIHSRCGWGSRCESGR